MKLFNQTDSSTQTCKKSILGLIVMFICALLAAGCSSGGGGDSFVAAPGGGVIAGGGGANAGTGSVTFNFVKAQAPITVPVSTVQLRFEFFNGLQGTGTIVKSEVRDFANTVTIQNVPASVQSSVVTAITAEGFPIAEFTVAVRLPNGGDVTVDAASGTTVPVTVTSVVSSPQSIALGNSDTFSPTFEVVFSNGDRVTVAADSGFLTFTSSMPSVATVDPATGVITAGLSGTAVITATFSAPGFAPTAVQVPVAVGDGVLPPPVISNLQILAPVGAQSLPRGTMSAPIVAQATFLDGSMAIVDTSTGLSIVSNNVAGGITISPNQEIVVASTATVNDTATITVSFMGSQQTINVTVNAEVLQSISVESVDLPYGGFRRTVLVTGTFSNGPTVPLNYADVDFTPNAFTRFTLDEMTGLITTNTATSVPLADTEQVTVNVTGAGFPAGINTTFDVTVGSQTVTSLNATPRPLELVPGDVSLITLTAGLSGGGTVIITDPANFDVGAILPTVTQSDNAPPNNVEVTANQIVAINPTGTTTAMVIFNVVGGGPAGANFPSDIVNVTVQDDVLDLNVALRYEFGGIPIDPVNNAVLLARGYVGGVEVYGTFTSGERQLTPDEYKLILGGSPFPANGEGAEAIKLFSTPPVPADPDIPLVDYYVHVPTNPLFTDGPENPGVPNQRINDLYFQPRMVADLGALTGSSASGTVDSGAGLGVAVTRATYPSVVADWRRGGQEFGQLSVPADEYVADVTGLPAPLNAQPFNSPNSSRTVMVRLDQKVMPAGEVNTDYDFDFTVTVTDPREVTIASAAFKNRSGDTRVPIGTVRELEVRVNFSAVTFQNNTSDTADYGLFGPTVTAVEGFKLAEANVLITSSLDFPVARSAPTSLGFVGVFSDQTVPSNIFAVRAIPVGGDNIRPVSLQDSDDDTTTDTYEDVTNVYGAVSGGFDEIELLGFVATRDQILTGPINEGDSEPSDFKVRIVTQNDQIQINFLNYVLFSINPPTVAGVGIGNNLAVGASRAYRTVVQYQVNGPLEDVSEDFPPVLFVDTAADGADAPAAVSRADNVTPGAFPGNILVSATDSAAETVDEADIDEQTGDVVLGDAITALFGANPNYGVSGLVISIDAAGFPIPFTGNFLTTLPDDDGNASPASTVSGINVIP